MSGFSVCPVGHREIDNEALSRFGSRVSDLRQFRPPLAPTIWEAFFCPGGPLTPLEAPFPVSPAWSPSRPAFRAP